MPRQHLCTATAHSAASSKGLICDDHEDKDLQKEKRNNATRHLSVSSFLIQPITKTRGT